MNVRRYAWIVVGAICLSLLGGPLVAADGAAAKQAIALDDVYRQESVSDFALHPDGQEAVYVRSWFDGTTLGRRTALYRASWDRSGDEPRVKHEPLEEGAPDGRHPVYSPDGRWIAFVSGRDYVDGTPAFAPVPPYSDSAGDVWLVRSQGGSSAWPLVGKGKPYGRVFADGFYGRLAFSPDGKRLAFVADDVREHRTEAERTAGVEVRAASIAGHEDDQGEGYEGYGPAQIWVAEVGEHLENAVHVPQIRRLVYDRYWYGDPQWTPDGNAIICHANRSDDQESVRFSVNKNYDLWRIPSSGSDPKYLASSYDQPQRLTLNPGPDVSPRISPDGSSVAYLSVPRKGPHADVYDVRLLTLGKEREERIVYAAHKPKPKPPSAPAGGVTRWYPQMPLPADAWHSPKAFYFRGVDKTRGGEEWVELDQHSPDQGRDRRERRKALAEAKASLTPRVNAWLGDRYQARDQIVKWKSFDGLEIEGILSLPPTELNLSAPYPLVVYPHGGPHSASRPGFNFTVEFFAANGFAVFQPNFRGTAGYGRDFLDAARFDMGGSDMKDILTGIDWLDDHDFIDKRRQFVYGISYGGYTTSRLVTLTDQFQAACAQNAVTDLHAMWSLSDLQSWTEWEFGGKPWETVEHDGRKIDVGALMRDRSPTTHAHKVKTPTLILHSDHDRRCPLPMGKMLHRALQENGCATELVIYEDERHGMWQMRHQADVLNRVLAWFRKHDRGP